MTGKPRLEVPHGRESRRGLTAGLYVMKGITDSNVTTLLNVIRRVEPSAPGPEERKRIQTRPVTIKVHLFAAGPATLVYPVVS